VKEKTTLLITRVAKRWYESRYRSAHRGGTIAYEVFPMLIERAKGSPNIIGIFTKAEVDILIKAEEENRASSSMESLGTQSMWFTRIREYCDWNGISNDVRDGTISAISNLSILEQYVIEEAVYMVGNGEVERADNIIINIITAEGE